MINKNLFFLNSFLDKISEEIDLVELGHHCSSEIGVYYSGPKIQNALAENREIVFRVDRKLISRLSGFEKHEIYTILRCFSIRNEGQSVLPFVLEDVTRILRKEGFFKAYYGPFSPLDQTDNIFTGLLDEQLWYEKKRKLYNSSLRTRNPKFQYKNLIEVLEELIRSFKPVPLPRSHPKRKVFRRGYRDHGSLASEESKINKEIASDYYYQQKILKEKEVERNTSLFIQGLLGLR